MADVLISIDGDEYPMPTEESFTMGESRIVKKYTGLVGQELVEIDATDPDYLAAIIHILFARQNHENGVRQSFAQIEERVDSVTMTSIEIPDQPDAEVDVLPPPSGDGLHVASNDESNSSGDGSNDDSDSHPATFPVSTGSQLLETGSG